MADIQKNIRTATAGKLPSSFGSNVPHAGGLQKQLFSKATKAFYRRNFYLASDVFEGEIQGVDYKDFYAWTPVKLRSSDLINPTTGEHLGDDWQTILLENDSIDYIPSGAYVYFNNNYWIVVNPGNTASIVGNAVVRRCNCTYNHLDYYGNVVKTPMSYSKGMSLASANWVTEYITLPSTYQHVILQLNDTTRDVKNNTRIILGGEGYYLTGMTNFVRDYTMEADSNHVIKAECRLSEANVYDDLENEVADAGAFSWEITMEGSHSMIAGTKQKLVPVSVRNGETPDGDKFPFSYGWDSSDTDVLAVDAEGNVTAKGAGSAEIECYLHENPSIRKTLEITVAKSSTNDFVQFLMPVPMKIGQYESFNTEAAYYEDGVKTENPITYTFSGPEETCYKAVTDGNTLIVTCYDTSNIPLTITASCNGQTAEQIVVLMAF
jgi:hypothetical protein